MRLGAPNKKHIRARSLQGNGECDDSQAIGSPMCMLERFDFIQISKVFKICDPQKLKLQPYL